MREKSIIHATVATTWNGLRELTVGKKTKRPAEVSGWQGLGRGPVAGDAKDSGASRFCRHGPAVGGRGQARGWEGGEGVDRTAGQRLPRTYRDCWPRLLGRAARCSRPASAPGRAGGSGPGSGSRA